MSATFHVKNVVRNLCSGYISFGRPHRVAPTGLVETYHEKKYIKGKGCANFAERHTGRSLRKPSKCDKEE